MGNKSESKFSIAPQGDIDVFTGLTNTLPWWDVEAVM